jgi:flagellar basal body rod protein FlgG
MPFGELFQTLSETINLIETNQATIGFKRRDAEFTAIVTNANSSGGVQVVTRRMVDKVDKTTDNSVYFAISADGMFIVNTLEDDTINILGQDEFKEAS